VRIVRPIAEQVADRGKEQQPEAQETRLIQRAGFLVIGGGQNGALQQVAMPSAMLAIPGQPVDHLVELLLEQAGPEFDDQMGLFAAGIPEVVRGTRWN
jgi:hypothetical protein